MKRTATSRETARLRGVITVVVVIAMLYLGRVVFIPLALALLLSVLLTPPVALLERIKVPRALGIFFVMAMVVSLLGLMGWRTSRQFVEVVSRIPTYRNTLQQKIHSIQGMRSKKLNKATDTMEELGKELANETPGSSKSLRKKGPAPGSSAAVPMSVEVVSPTNPITSIQNTLGPLVTAVVVVIFTVFIIMGRENLRDRLIRLAGGGRLNVMTQAMGEATSRIHRYLLLQFLVNACYGVVIGVALHLIGIPNASLWGAAATLLRFLPYVGAPLAASMPILLSLAVFPGWYHALATMGVFLVLELVVANFVEPYLYGTHTGLSPLAILVAAVFWTLIWSIPGLLLSTPITVCLVVMGRYVPSLGFLNVLLGDEDVLPLEAQFYQRLLAKDDNEARQILEEFLKEKPLEELYSSVVVPALMLAERDRHRNELDEDAQEFIYQTTRELVAELGDTPAEKAGTGGPGQLTIEAKDGARSARMRMNVICLPARDDADDVIAMMLSQLLEIRGYKSRSIRIGMVTEMLAQVAAEKPDIVCISALPPFALDHTRRLYTQLRQQFPELPVNVCIWRFEGDPSRMAARLKLTQRDGVFTTLSQALHNVDSRAENRQADVDPTSRDEGAIVPALPQA